MGGVDYDPRTALMVTDVQNDFADPSRSLYVKGADGIVGVVNAEIRAAREAGAVVVYTEDWHPAQTRHFVTGGGHTASRVQGHHWTRQIGTVGPAARARGGRG